MAAKGDIESDLTLEVGGHAITPDKFLRSVRSFFAILDEVTREVGGKTSVVRWAVAAKRGSNLIQVSPQPGYDPSIISVVTKAVADGISQIEERETRPTHFNERALRSLRDLSNVVGRTDSDDTTVRVWVRRDPIDVTPKAAANIIGLLANEHEDYGSLEGRLQTLTERGRLQFIVYERLWDMQTRCYIPDRLVETALAAFRSRVEVYGLIRYRKDGKTVSIEVDEIRAFPEAEKIPSFRDVHGILRRSS